MRALLVLGALPLAACSGLPLSLIVPAEARDALAHTEYAERVPEAEVRAHLERSFGFRGAPAPLAGSGFRRLDPGGGPSQDVDPRALDDALHPLWQGLRTGDLMLAKNPKAQSLGSTLALADFAFYDHLGLLAFEEGRAWVYESWPRVSLWPFARDFASRFQGRVARVRASRFLARYEVLEVVRLPDPAQAAALARRARASLAEDLRFDPHHDPEDPRLSCSEYLEYLMGQAFGATSPLAPTPATANASARALVTSLGFHTRGYVVPDRFGELPGARPVALFSSHACVDQVRALRAAFALLHARLGPEGSVGSFLAFDGRRLVRYRRNVSDFLRWTLGLYAERSAPPDEALAREVHELAVPFFRPQSCAP